jgi:hypothetical protein
MNKMETDIHRANSSLKEKSVNRRRSVSRKVKAKRLAATAFAAFLAFTATKSIEQNSGPNVLHPITDKITNTIEVNTEGVYDLKPGEVYIQNGNGITWGNVQIGIPQYAQRIINGLRSRGKQLEVECKGTAYDTINGPDYPLNIQSAEIVPFETSTRSEGKIIDEQTNNVLTFGTNSAFSGFIVNTTIGIKNHKGEFTALSSFTSSLDD